MSLKNNCLTALLPDPYFVIPLYHPKIDSGNFYVTLQLELCPFGS